MKSQRLKRIMDIAGAFVGLILIAPFMFIISLLIYFSMGRPIFFRQVRPGLNGKPFVIYKFRTMHDLRDIDENLLPDEKRLTTIGKLLRKFSIDELPELFNVLKGDMSLVGPRPLLTEYLDRYNIEQARRHEVKPGMTGWAQVNGRNAISWEEKFKYDVWYVDNWSILLDFKILLLTIVKVLKFEGINARGHATMPEFKGE